MESSEQVTRKMPVVRTESNGEAQKKTYVVLREREDGSWSHAALIKAPNEPVAREKVRDAIVAEEPDLEELKLVVISERYWNPRTARKKVRSSWEFSR